MPTGAKILPGALKKSAYRVLWVLYYALLPGFMNLLLCAFVHAFELYQPRFVFSTHIDITLYFIHYFFIYIGAFVYDIILLF